MHGIICTNYNKLHTGSLDTTKSGVTAMNIVLYSSLPLHSDFIEVCW